MKAKIKIERYDNGITLKWSSPDHDDEAVVALDHEKEKTIGKMIWDDIKSVMDGELCNVVTMNIEYEKGE